MSFNWLFFLFLSGSITLSRILILAKQPLARFSVDNAVWLGFILFFALPAGFAPELIRILPGDYAVYILLSYWAFCVASTLAAKSGALLSKSRLLSLSVTPQLLRVALTYCLVFVTLRFIRFFQGGGMSAVRDLWLFGDPMRAYLCEAESLAMQPHTREVAAVLLRTLEIMFFAMWGVVFKRKPSLSIIVWYMYVLTLLNEYMGRTALAVFLLIPWACYLQRSHRSVRMIFLQVLGVLVAASVFLTALSYLRLGHIERISGLSLYDVVEELKASVSPVVYGTWVFGFHYRGDWAEYLIALLSYPLPRVMWANKPLIEFNLMMTSMITGRSVGPDNAIITFTMMGEGWFFFGALGPIIIMFLFGVSAKMFEKLFLSNDLFLASYGFLVFNALLQIRSTFLGFYSSSLAHFITVLILLLIIKLLRVVLTTKPASVTLKRI